jgi:pilus assembly protein CpaB
MVRVLVLIVALLAGAGAGWMALSARGAPPAAAVAPAAPAIPTQEILVAGSDLVQGQPVTKVALRWQTWPEHAVAPGYIKRSARPDAAEQLVGLMARSRFTAGEPIREEKLAPSGAGYLATVLATGKRAVGVRVSAESSAGGFVLPGDRVDVLHTQTLNDAQKSKSSRTILRNVTVLAIDQNVDETAKQKPAVVGKTATLELDPEHAEIIIAAEASGMLSLVLRSASDNSEVAPAVQQTTQAIRIFRGGKAETVDTK